MTTVQTKGGSKRTCYVCTVVIHPAVVSRIIQINLINGSDKRRKQTVEPPPVVISRIIQINLINGSDEYRPCETLMPTVIYYRKVSDDRQTDNRITTE